jgi:hypothetical protein
LAISHIQQLARFFQVQLRKADLDRISSLRPKLASAVQLPAYQVWRCMPQADLWQECLSPTPPDPEAEEIEAPENSDYRARDNGGHEILPGFELYTWASDLTHPQFQEQCDMDISHSILEYTKSNSYCLCVRCVQSPPGEESHH